MKFDIKKNLPHILAVIIILLLNVFYFFPQFQGKVIQSGDITSHKGMSHEAVEYRKASGEEALWTNSMFGGMPTYNISTQHKNNITRFYEKATGLFLPRPAGMFVMGMIGFYICLLLLGVNPWVSLIMSIVFGFTTGNLMLLGAGHNTKVRAIMASAPIIAGVILTMRGRLWIGALVFSAFLGINIMCNHPQMTYYLAIVLGIYMVIALVDAIKNKTMPQFAKGAGVLALCGVLALGASATKMLPTYEYSKLTMRGDAILKADNTKQTNSSSEVNGLDWNYAMNWSAGMLDLVSTFIPYAAGGGTVEEFPKDSQYAKLTQSRKKVSSYSYFGALPSTAGPYYFGAVLFLLFILGALLVPGRIKWWLVSATVLTMLMAMGKNFEVLNRAMFDYIPMFNKFRTPNSILSITGILMTVLAGLGLNEVVKAKDKEKLWKPALISIGAVAGFSILFALVGPSMISFGSAYDSRLGGNQQVIDALYADRSSMMAGSAWRTAILVLLAGVTVLAFLKDKISTIFLLLIVGLLSIGDSFSVSKNYFSSNFVTKRQNDSAFNMKDADKQILADKDPHYRVQDFASDTYNSARSSYYHKTVGGYSPVKMQRINDVITQYLGKRSQENPLGNEQILNMLNTKYFIVPAGEGKTMAQQNPGALGNAWFVSNVNWVNSPNEEFDAIKNFNPGEQAVINNEFKDYIGTLSPNKNGNIQLKSYSPNALEYTSNSSSDQLAVFSEIWYGPDLGWQAYIDDQPVEHVRANYLLRAMKVPAGQHTIRFEFKPSSYYTGKMISLVSSILMVLIAGFAGYKMWQEKTV